MTDKSKIEIQVTDRERAAKPTMKRTKHINLNTMRKGFSVKPLALGVAA